MWDHWQRRQGFSSNKVDNYDWAFPRDEEVMDRSSREAFMYIIILKRVQGRIGRALAEWKSGGDFSYKCQIT